MAPEAHANLSNGSRPTRKYIVRRWPRDCSYDAQAAEQNPYEKDGL